MKRKLKAGSTSIMLPIRIYDSSSTTGGYLASLVYNSSGLTAKYRRDGQSSWTSITLASAVAGTFTSDGFCQATSAPTGAYEFHIRDAALAAGAKWVEIELYGATNMVPVRIEIELDAVDYQTDAFGAVKPTVAGRTLSIASTGEASADATKINGVAASSVTTINAHIGTTQPVNYTGTGASAVVKSETTSMATDSITSSAVAASAITEIHAGLSTLDAAGVRTAVGLASANLDTQLSTLAGYMDTEVAAIKAKTDNLPASPAATSDIPTVAQIWTTVLTESYRSTGAAGTAAQLMHEILQNITEFAISGSTKTVKKFDGVTTAKTYTLDSATAPTSITEAT